MRRIVFGEEYLGDGIQGLVCSCQFWYQRIAKIEQAIQRQQDGFRTVFFKVEQ